MGMDRIMQSWRGGVLAGVVAAGLAVSPQAFAQEAPIADEGGMKVSGSLNLDWNSHFISYGLDVWAGGTSWNKSTFNPAAELSFDLDLFSINVGTWWDVNSNADSSIGGQLQEVDVWYGISIPVADFTFGITYQDWMYGGQVEKILDLSVGYDDSALWGDFMGGDFALNPSLTFHQRLAGEGLEEHFAVVVGIEPGMSLIESETFSVDLSVPVSVGFFEGDFHGGDSGFGFVSVGAQFSTPLAFIPAEYGSWAVNYGITYYYTDKDVIPNPKEHFVTGNVGVSLSF
jgi:hypothetical protein